MSDPDISVIVPVYNAAQYLGEAIDSIAAQHYRAREIVVVDDGSTDGSAAVAKRYAPLVRYCWQPNLGVGAARNRGVELAIGNLLAFLDADDCWVEDKLQLQTAVLADDPTLDMVFGHVRQLRHGPEWDRGVAEKACDASALLPGSLPGTMLVRRETVFRVGLFRTDCRVGEFVDWYTRAIDLGCRAKVLRQLLLWRRIHDSNLGIRERNSRHHYARVLKTALDRRRSARERA